MRKSRSYPNSITLTTSDANSSRKFRESLKKFGFTFANNRITKLGEDGQDTTATTKKAAPKKTKGKAAPKPRKHKLSEDDRDAEEEITEDVSEDAEEDAA